MGFFFLPPIQPYTSSTADRSERGKLRGKERKEREGGREEAAVVKGEGGGTITRAVKANNPISFEVLPPFLIPLAPCLEPPEFPLYATSKED